MLHLCMGSRDGCVCVCQRSHGTLMCFICFNRHVFHNFETADCSMFVIVFRYSFVRHLAYQRKVVFNEIRTLGIFNEAVSTAACIYRLTGSKSITLFVDLFLSQCI
jgi:hypothetical protein